MSAEPLKALTIEHLRGATTPFTLHFEKAKKLTVVYGENGTGKSTLCDGMELLGRGSISSLDGKGLGQTLSFWPSVGKKTSDVTVSLTSATKSCSARIVKKSVVVDQEENRPVVEVLRRSQLLRLIETEPAKRYAEIQRFVDISHVEGAEATLRSSIKDLERNRDIAVARIGENERALGDLWNQAGSPLPNALKWAETESVRDQSQLNADMDALSKSLKALNELHAAVNAATKAEAMVGPANDTLATARKALETASAAVAEGASDLVDILDATKRYLQTHSQPKVCPLCESAENVANLADRTAERIAQFSALSAAKKHFNSAERASQAATQTAAAAEQAVLGKVELYTVATATPLPGNVSAPALPESNDLTAFGAWVSETADSPTELTRALTSLSEQKQLRKLLVAALKNYRDNTEEQQKLDKLLPRLRQTLVICEEERRKFTDGILTAISDEVGRIYEKMHPGEGLSKITFQLDAAKRASLQIGSNCYGQDNAPPRRSSASHTSTPWVFASSSRWPKGTPPPKPFWFSMTCSPASMNHMLIG